MNLETGSPATSPHHGHRGGMHSDEEAGPQSLSRLEQNRQNPRFYSRLEPLHESLLNHYTITT